MLHFFRVLAIVAATLVAACGHVTNIPLNRPVSDANAGLGTALLRETPDPTDDLMVGLAFSGGGMRAAAFSFGVLKELARADIVIRHNTIFIPEGTSAIISHPTDNANVTVERNLFGGGAYTVYCPESSVNYRLVDNRFTTLYGPRGGAFGPWEGCGAVAANHGNVWDETLAPLEL